MVTKVSITFSSESSQKLKGLKLVRTSSSLDLFLCLALILFSIRTTSGIVLVFIFNIINSLRPVAVPVITFKNNFIIII